MTKNDTVHSPLGQIVTFPYWADENGYRHFFQAKRDDEVRAYLAQQARDLGNLYVSTNDKKYADIAAQLAAWFFGKNETGKNMYDRNTGRGYDGIKSKDTINYNSGAESTIEALLSLQCIEKEEALIEALRKRIME